VWGEDTWLPGIIVKRYGAQVQRDLRHHHAILWRRDNLDKMPFCTMTALSLEAHARLGNGVRYRSFVARGTANFSMDQALLEQVSGQSQHTGFGPMHPSQVMLAAEDTESWHAFGAEVTCAGCRPQPVNLEPRLFALPNKLFYLVSVDTFHRLFTQSLSLPA